MFQVLTKDSVTVSVDAVVYYRVSNATVSVANVENAHHSTRWAHMENIIWKTFQSKFSFLLRPMQIIWRAYSLKLQPLLLIRIQGFINKVRKLTLYTY